MISSGRAPRFHILYNQPAVFAMKSVFEKAVGRGEQLGLLVLGSPEILFSVVLCGFGGAAAGWFLIGIGSLFALVPLIGFAVYRILAGRNQDGRV
jgi:hypothetical protein